MNVIFLILCTVDDIIKNFLAEYRQKKHSNQASLPAAVSEPRLPSASSSSQPSSSPPNQNAGAQSHEHWEGGPSTSQHDHTEGAGESWVSIPELPIGRELVINILSTWGDRFYVGLTGLQIFTASGEQANVEQVSHVMLPE